MIRQPPAIFVSVRTLQAHVFPMLISSHFGGDQKVKITYKLQNYLITLVSMKSRLVNTQGIFGGAKLLTNITLGLISSNREESLAHFKGTISLF